MSMRIFTAIFLLTIAAAAAESPLPELRIEPTGGGSIFYIRNTASQLLTAYVIELVDYPGSYYALWEDYTAGEPIAPGAEKRLQVANMTVGAVPDYVKMRAALYADGTSAGIQEKVAQLIARRGALLETTRELIQRAGKSQPSAKSALISDLKTWAGSLEPSGKGRRDSQAAVNQAAARSLITDTVASLEAHSTDEVLAGLRDAERKLAASKPAPAVASANQR